ncbi:MAG: hypothetical protein AUH11_09910 [Acidobacteria bacterium 13_2_20CM_57_17]|nr:MAG: hypothetical protein AUH11_09910 [Acidobacteria bacterium 13_2_20CM_57_17]OLB94806.1 MAG: hypothetical protein AUI02_04665 [Acidobacteria bacterium 13_2_20CM_2_57_12]OLE15921.1 MAG: hypothetical protein AUG83_05100 [Acidobacteria bacterium 13_1_20CM_4_57_11]
MFLRRRIVLKHKVQAGVSGNLSKPNGGECGRGLQVSAFSGQLGEQKGTGPAKKVSSRKHQKK